MRVEGGATFHHDGMRRTGIDLMPYRRPLCLLLLAMAVVAGACGSSQKDAANESGPVTIQFWHAMTAAPESTLVALTDRFNASQDRVKVQLVYQGGYQDIINKYLASVKGGQVPALMQVDDVGTQLMVDSQTITPVQDFIDAENYDLSDYVPRVLDYYRLGGRLYSMPWNVSNPVLYYNKKAFRDAGLDPDRPPRTLEEITQYSEKLLRRDDSGRITRHGIVLEISPWYVEQMLAKHGDLYVNNGNGRDGRATEAVFNGDAGKAIFRWWADMVRSGLALNVGENRAGIEDFLAIGAGRAVMTFWSSAALRSIADVLASGQFPDIELGVGELPSLAGGNGGILVGGGSLWIIARRPEAEQRAAWEFIKYLLEPEQQAEWYAGSGYVPVRISATELPAAKQVEAKYPEFRIALEQLRNAPSTRASQGALMGAFPQVRDAIQRGMEDMLLNNRDPAEAADRAAREATKEIQDYNRRVGD